MLQGDRNYTVAGLLHFIWSSRTITVGRVLRICIVILWQLLQTTTNIQTHTHTHTWQKLKKREELKLNTGRHN